MTDKQNEFSDSTEIKQQEEALQEALVYPFPYYIPVVQFALRMLGVYATAVGASYALQNAIEIFLLEHTLYLEQLFASLTGNVAYMFFGMYLCVSGRWIIENVFLPTQDDGEVSESEDQEEMRNEE